MRLHLPAAWIDAALARGGTDEAPGGETTGEPGPDLPEGPARHLQVLRAQPGDAVEVFDGAGRAWSACVTHMGRRSVSLAHWAPLDDVPGLEPALRATLAVAMPANDRMDFLVEKATELGGYAIQPLVSARSVLRLDGERAARRVQHWQQVAAAAAEQCGRRVVPLVHPVQALAPWLQTLAERSGDEARWVLHPPQATGLPTEVPPAASPAPSSDATPPGRALVLSGPEGGLTEDEVALAEARGFGRLSLGPRILRADTAPLAWLASRLLPRP